MEAAALGLLQPRALSGPGVCACPVSGAVRRATGPGGHGKGGSSWHPYPWAKGSAA